MYTLLAICIIFVLVIIALTIHNHINKQKRLELKKKKEEEDKYYRQQREEWLMKDAERREGFYKTLITKMSNPSKIIRLPTDNDLTSLYIMINEKTEQVLLKNKVYSFSDILDYSLYDNQTIIEHQGKQKITSTTRTNTGDAIGRAFIGGVLAGEIGAVIGGVTAKQITDTTISVKDTTQETDHDYTIIVNINSIKQPIERIHLFKDKRLTDEICGLLSIIISRNKPHRDSVLS